MFFFFLNSQSLPVAEIVVDPDMSDGESMCHTEGSLLLLDYILSIAYVVYGLCHSGMHFILLVFS